MKKIIVACLAWIWLTSAFAGKDDPSITGGTDAWAGSGHRFATVTDVYDGDTVTADIELGYGIILKDQKLRLYGINTPEVRGSEKVDGLVTRDVVRDLILHKRVVLDPHNFQKGKYGRWLATIWYKPDSDGTTWINLNAWLIKSGFGRAASY